MSLQTTDRASAHPPTQPHDVRRGPSAGLGALLARRGETALATLILIALAALCWHFNAKPRHDAFAALPDTLRVLLGAGVVFGLCGFGLVRLALPEPLRRYELLWVLPTGACVSGLALTVLGFAGIPYAASLALVLAAGVALGAYAIRREGWPAAPLGRLGRPLLLTLVVLVVALVPMLLVQHIALPIGTGSDAHVAAGTAQFLKHAYPTSTDIGQPINQMPPLWQSKYPIYYAFAAVSSVSGLATWQALAPLVALLLALAAVGLFLVAVEVFGAPVPVALAAMGVAGLDRMALHTGFNPYFNQTWGYFALPFTLALAWIAAQPALSRGSRRGAILLTAVFGLVMVLAYPLAAPIPAVPIVVFAFAERRRRIRAGEHVVSFSDLYTGRRSLLWMVPVGAALAIPVAGAVDKAVSAAQVLAPGHSLIGWGGDLRAFIPFNYFFSLPNSVLGIALLALVAALAVRGLAGQPRALALGLGGLLLFGVALAVYLRHRQYGYYFHFKLLAFIGPLVLVIAAVGAGRLRRLGVVALGALAVATGVSTVDAIRTTGSQLAPSTIALSAWAKALPHGASVRLDMWPPEQLWTAYFMSARPLCSMVPLLGTDYPHVAISRKADYILLAQGLPRPADALGPVLRENLGYRLYRESPDVPGPSRCTQRRFDRLYSGPGFSRYG